MHTSCCREPPAGSRPGTDSSVSPTQWTKTGAARRRVGTAFADEGELVVLPEMIDLRLRPDVPGSFESPNRSPGPSTESWGLLAAQGQRLCRRAVFASGTENDSSTPP